MSSCPVPDNSSLSYTSPPYYVNFAPNDPVPEGTCNQPAVHQTTGGGETGTSTERTQYCVGPQGPCGKGIEFKGQWATGTDYWIASPPTVCSTDIVFHNGRAYIAKLDHIADSTNEPGVGTQWQTYWDLFYADDNKVVWRGFWEPGVSYAENDYVTHKGASFMCTSAHTSSLSNQPDQEFDYEGGPVWILVSTGEQPSFFNQQKSFLGGLADGFLNWVKDIPNWGITDWLKAIALGAGAIWVGSKIVNMMSSNGKGNGQGGVVYNGSPGYSGSYTVPSLPAVLDDLLQRAGFLPSEYDLSQVPNQPVEGIFATNPSVSEAIDNIVFAYQLNIVNTGGVFKITPRSSSPIATIPDGDFGFTDSNEHVGRFTAKRLQSTDLPRKVIVEYISRNLDYNSFSQETPFLESFPEGKIVQVSLPFVLTPEQARNVADFMLIQPHLERNTWTGTTTYKWAKLEPGDIITTSKGNGRIIEIQENNEGLIDIVFCDAGLPQQPEPVYSGPIIIGYTASDYVGSNVPPVPEPVNNNQVIDYGYSGLIVVDAPPLEKDDNKPRVLLAVHGYGNPNWPGAVVFKSVDGGQTYSQIASTTVEATVGMVEIPLGNPTDYHIWDNVNTVDVELKTGYLESKSEISVLSGANWAMIGNEVIGFKTATLIGTSSRGNKIFRLSGLLRGLQGTEWVFDQVAHQSQELFVLLDNKLIYHEISPQEFRTPIKYKVVSIGGNISNVDPEEYAVVPINMVPWKVGHPKVTKDCTTRDFNITWTPRSRSMGDGLEDHTEIENDPDWGGWTVAVYQGLTEKRKWHVMTPYTKYTLQNQIEDFGSEQTSISVKIAAMNRVHGTGYPTSCTSNSC